MSDSLVMTASGLAKKKYPGLKMPSPEFNLARLRKKKPTGLLSRVERNGRVGVDQVLVNELSKPEDEPFAFAVITMGPGQKFAGIGALPPAVAAGLDEFTRREFQRERSFWYHPFALAKDFPKPKPMTKPVPGRRFAGDVDVRDGKAEPVPTEKWEGVPDPFADDDAKPREPGNYGEYAEPIEKFAVVLPGASSPYRVARLESTNLEDAAEEAGSLGALRGLDEVLLAQRIGATAKSELPVYKVHGTVVAAAEETDIASVVESGDPVKLRGMKIEEVREVAETLRRFHRAEFEGKPTTVVNSVSREDVLNAYVFVVRELRSRGEKVEPKREIDSEAMDIDQGLFRGEVEKGIRAPWGSPGGKRWLAHTIASIIPEHKKYVEPFAGGAAVFWAKQPSEKEVLADLDEDTIEGFKFIRDMRDTEFEKLAALETERDEMLFAQLKASSPSGRIKKFHRWLYLRFFSYGAKGENDTINRSPKSNLSLKNTLDSLKRCRDRLKGVSLHAQDWKKTVREQDEKSVVFYLDPPYAETTCDSLLPKGMEPPTNAEIEVVLEKVKGFWILSLNDSASVRKAFAKYHLRKVETPALRAEGAVNYSRKELLISNFPLRRLKKSDESESEDAELLCPWCGERGEQTDCEKCGKPMVASDHSAKSTDESEERECAPTCSSGEKQGRRIYLHEVLEKVRPFRFRQDAITIVGGIANRGWTDNDIDVLIKGPIDEDTLHVLKFRLGRMLGPELSQRVQFLDDSLGGPMTDHVPLGNLMFETAPDFQVKEMRGLGVSKQDDPLQDLPLKPGKLDAVLQAHARGRTIHADLRIKVRDYLVGFTLSIQRAGVIKEPVTTVAQLKAITRNYDVETGNKFLKPILAPKGVFVAPKTSRQPVVWMGVEDRVFPAGTVGGTKEFPGVIIVLDRPKIEYGRQSPRFHEYFATGSKLKDGIWFARQLVGEEEEVPEEEVGRITPVGEVFWRFSISKLFMPSILKPRTVKRKVMPPDGWSWIPQSLERDVPSEFRYWKKKGAEARKIRDALVEERIFTEKTVGLVDGEFRLVREKRFVVNDGEDIGVVRKQPKRVPYVLSRQSFRGPIVVRAGFSKVFWWLVLDKPKAKGVRAWRLQTNPLGGEARISAVEATASETRDKVLLALRGDQPPKSRWNPTKATPSDVRPVGDGKVDILEEKAGFLRLRFVSGPLRGTWTLVAEEPDSRLWEFSSGAGPGLPMSGEKRDGFVPPKAVADAASLGLELRREFGRGGTEIGVARARDLSNRRALSADTIKRMRSYFARHAVDAEAKGSESRGFWEDSENPSAGWIAWLLWGGDLGRDWAEGLKIEKAIPVRDTIQIWDPDKKQPDVDRTDLRPLANFAPMKPREGFFDPNELIDEWATPEIVKAGLDAESKKNGLRCIAEVDGRGRTFIYFEDARDDRSEILPGVAAEVKALGEKVGPFILDTELLDFDEDGNAQPRRTLSRFTGPVKPQDDSRVKLMAFRLVYGLNRNWTADPRSDARPALEKFFEKAGRLKHLKILPFKTVKSVEDIPALIKWASEQPGGEGAMFKMHESTYTLGRFTSSWCFPPYQEVLTPTGSVRVDSLKVGDELQSLRGERITIMATNRQSHDGDIIRFKPLCLPAFAVTPNHRVAIVRDGQKLRTAEMRDHRRIDLPLLVSGGVADDPWKPTLVPAGEVTTDDLLVFPKYQPRGTGNYDGEFGPPEFAWFLGWLVAEGFSDHASRVRVACKYPSEDFDQGVRIAEEVFGRDELVIKMLIAKFNDREFPAQRLTIKNRRFSEWFGERFGWGADAKRLPSDLLDTSPEILRAFLQGYWAGDGNSPGSRGVVQCATVSRDLAWGLTLAFSRFGWLPSWHETPADGTHRAIMRLSLNNQQDIVPHACTIPPSKRKFTRVLERKSNLLLPIRKLERKKYSGEVCDVQTSSGRLLAPVEVSNSKLKITRSVRAIVVEKIPKKPPPEQKVPARTFVYRCAVGPIPKKDLDNFGELVKIKGEWYTEIGKTFATNVQARVGQTLEVQATEFLVDLSVPKKTVHWFTPVVTARVDERPNTFDEVVDVVFEHEVKRKVEKLLDGPVRLLKAEEKGEERFVLGVVSEPKTDSQEDLAPKKEIRKACHDYMEFYRGTGLMHRERLFGGRVRICECWYQRGDTEINGEPVYDGSWLMAWRIVDDALWKDVKAGKLTGFSIQGSAVREPVS